MTSRTVSSHLPQHDGDAEFELEFVERVDAFRDRGTDLSVGNRLAHTDNHGRSSIANVNANYYHFVLARLASVLQ